eukprot:7376859-Prymnesium_polylepis.1
MVSGARPQLSSDIADTEAPSVCSAHPLASVFEMRMHFRAQANSVMLPRALFTRNDTEIELGGTAHMEVKLFAPLSLLSAADCRSES